jgi:hypothetical protein
VFFDDHLFSVGALNIFIFILKGHYPGFLEPNYW